MAAACKAIAAKLGRETAKPARIWMLRQLEFNGGAECVTAVAVLLRDEDPQIRDCARRALQNNPAPQANATLLEGLGAAVDDIQRVAIVNALGYRADPSSVATVARLLTSDNQSLAAAAANALGKIGGPQAAAALNTAQEQVKLTASDVTAGDRFGWSVSMDGDYAVVGAYNDDDRGTNSGAAYIFKRDGTTWTQRAKLTASDGAADDRFGNSVYIDGDYAVVGAYRDDDRGGDSGSAYIFKRDGTTWSQQAKLTANDGAADDWFSRPVSIDGDYALVGAFQNDDHGSNSGSAYIFKRDGTTWTQQAKLRASDGAADDRFGRSVCPDGIQFALGNLIADTVPSAELNPQPTSARVPEGK